MAAKPRVAFRRYSYPGSWGLGINYFRNPYGSRGISIHLMLFYVHIHWVVKRDGISTDEDDE